MHVIITGNPVYGQQIGEWIHEVEPGIEPTYVTRLGDLPGALEQAPCGPLLLVAEGAWDGLRIARLLRRLPEDRVDDVHLLSPPGVDHAVLEDIPLQYRSRLGSLRRERVQAALADRDCAGIVPLGVEEQLPTLHFGYLVGESQAMQRVYRRIDKVAGTDCCCLISGETGTGKEQVARAIHARSRRAGAPFVAMNAGAIPRELVESELFGHEKGAFTGAVARREGLLERADHGTLLIDEIGELPLELQPVFLRALQDGEITPVGSSRPRQVHVRYLAATNRDLAEAVRNREFREDLYYRLDVVPIVLPPLRERIADIPALILYWSIAVNRAHGLSIRGIDQDCLDAFCEFDWPGNVRQLFNYLERAMVLCDGDVLRLEDVPAEMLRSGRRSSMGMGMDVPEDGLDFYAETERFQRAILEQVLDRVSWNKNRAANLLRMNRTTLVERLKRLGMTGEQLAAGAA